MAGIFHMFRRKTNVYIHIWHGSNLLNEKGLWLVQPQSGCIFSFLLIVVLAQTWGRGMPV
jgi:hypothetical protein